MSRSKARRPLPAGGPPVSSVALVEAMREALFAGAQPQMLPRPRRLLCPGPLIWQARAHAGVDRDQVLALLNAHPQQVDGVLAQWQGVTEELTAYTRAQATSDASEAEWWRQRLLEDYGYVIGQSSIICAQTLPWWQARMVDSYGPGPDITPQDAA